MIQWQWKDVFWCFWFFFSIMIGINVGFFIILVSKCYQKYNEQSLDLFERKLSFFQQIVQGLSWFFVMTIFLTINSSIFVNNFIQI